MCYQWRWWFHSVLYILKEYVAQRGKTSLNVHWSLMIGTPKNTFSIQILSLSWSRESVAYTQTWRVHVISNSVSTLLLPENKLNKTQSRCNTPSAANTKELGWFQYGLRLTYCASPPPHHTLSWSSNGRYPHVLSFSFWLCFTAQSLIE